MQAYSMIIFIITVIFFFHFNLTYFSTEFKRHIFFDYKDVNFNAGLSICDLKPNTPSFKIAL